MAAPTPGLGRSRESSIVNYNGDHATVRAEFLRLRQEFTLTNFNNEPFVLVDALTEVLCRKPESKAHPENIYKHDLHRLLATSHFRRHTDPHFGLDMLQKYHRIFFILVEIECPHLIESFHRRNICDTDLPLDRARLKERIAPFLQGSDSSHLQPQQFCDRFLQEQLAWCPMIIEQGMHDVCPSRVMPFLAQTEIRPEVETQGANGSRATQYNATLFKIEVPEDLIGPELKKTLEPSLFWEKQITQKDKSTTRSIRYFEFALKQFPKNLESSFLKENRAFTALSSQEGMIQYYGCCEDTATTCSIILELGDCDLYTAIRSELPPVSPTEINAFWYAMLGLAKALAKMSKTILDGLEYDVWHADIKPENILRVGNRFKLADPGEALFVKAAEGEDKPAGANITGGTRTYAAPEKALYLENNAIDPESVPPSSDVWSLGCVFSVAATYVVLGTQGVLQFDEIRRQKKASRTVNQRNWPDAFYDDKGVRQVVTDWHAYLRQAARGTDDFTAKVLDMIDSHALVPASERWDAVKFSQELEELIEVPLPDLDVSPFPHYIEEMLREIDPKAELERERSADGRSRVESERTKKLFRSQRLSGSGADPRLLQVTDVGRLLGENIKPTAQRSQPRTFDAKNLYGRRLSLNRPSRTSSSYTSNTNRSRTALDTHMINLRLNEAAPREYENESTQRPPTMTMWQLERMLQKSGKQRRSLKDIRKFFGKKSPASVKGLLGEDDHLEKYYKNRDIVYLVDNGSSMLPHWGKVCFLLKVLVWRSLGYDDDGMELYFSNPDTRHCVRQSKDQGLEDFDKCMEAAEPIQRGHTTDSGCRTNLCPKLSEIISSYVSQVNSAKEPKPKTIIVLTDGLWEGYPSEDAIRDIIGHNLRILAGILSSDGERTATQHSRLAALSKTRPFTIQFISFGGDAQGLSRMASLDDDMVDYPDLVDVEPSDGDIYKMFAGSLDDIWDKKENNVNRPSTTPVRVSYTETGTSISRRSTRDDDSGSTYS